MSERDCLVEALAFYAKPSTYEPETFLGMSPIQKDGGSRARAALEKVSAPPAPHTPGRVFVP